MKWLGRGFLLGISLLYPFLLYFGLRYSEPRLLVLLLVVLAISRWFSPEGLMGPRWMWVLMLVPLGAIVWVSGDGFALKFYPVMVNLLLLAVFWRSLHYGSPIIEHVARLSEPDLPVHAVIYTRQVTQVWVYFFAFNATVATYTAVWGSDELWLLYNGFVSYGLIGLLLLGELVVRQRVRKKYD